MNHLLPLAALVGAVVTPQLHAQTPAFTYQGRLQGNGSPAGGLYDLRFELFDASTNGVSIGVLTNTATQVSNGLFTVTLDFGAGVFDGSELWLGISVATNGGGTFSTLSPRQKITPTPLAIRAQQAQTVPAGAITGEMISDGAVSQLGTPDGSDPEALSMSDEGFVGLGTSNPQAALHVSGGHPVPDIELLFSITNGTGSFTNIIGIESLAHSDNLLAIASSSSSAVTLLDVSDPSAPVVASQLRDGVDGFDLLSGVRRVSLSGNLLVISARPESAVTLVDVSDPANPAKLTELIDGQGGWTNLGGAMGTSISGNLLAITAEGDDAVTLADISNPASPVKLSEMILGQSGFDDIDNPVVALISDTNLYVGSFFVSTVTIVGIDDPSNPVPLAVYTSSSAVDGLAISGDLLAVGVNPVVLLDVSHPDSPVPVAEIQVGTKTPVFFQDLLTLPRANLYDLTVPTAPVEFVTFEGSEGGSVLAVAENHIFSAGSQTLAVFGIGDGNSDEEISLVTSGRVGVGTDVPLADLHVRGSSLMQGDAIVKGPLSVAGEATIAGPLSVIGEAVLGGNVTVTGSLTASSSLFGSRMYAASSGFSFLPAYSFGSDPDTGMYRPTTDALAFSTDGDERVRISATGRVGVGTASPATTLDVNGTISGNGSGLSDLNATELISGTVPSARISGTYSSAVTFGNAANSFTGDGSGLINLALPAIPDGHSLDALDGSPADAIQVDAAGQVGIGTAAPEGDVHIRGNSSTGSLLVTPNASDSRSQILLAENTSASLGMIIRYAGNQSANPLHVIGWNGDVESAPLLSIERNTGDVGLGTGSNSIDGRLHVQANGARVAKFDRYNSDGELVAWARDDTVVGNVTVASGVVSYNAFTGSHYAWSEEEPVPGTLMTLTGENRPLHGDSTGEIVYGIRASSHANDPATLGAYLDTTPIGDHDQAHEVRLVSAVGNGELWVVDTGADIRPGDLLISSDVAGCVMLDNPSRFPVGHIVARAAQAVRWSEVEVGTDGIGRTKLSVLFDPFTRGLQPSSLPSQWTDFWELKEELKLRDQEISELKHELLQIKNIMKTLLLEGIE